MVDVPAGRALCVFSNDILTVVHTAPGYGESHGIAALNPGDSTQAFSMSWSPSLVATIVSAIAAERPHSFSYRVTGLDGVERAFESRLIVPFGAGRPVVVEAWVAGTVERGAGLAPHPDLEAVLEALEPELPPESLLETLLLVALEASGYESLAVIDHQRDDAVLLATVGERRASWGEGASADELGAAFPTRLAESADHLHLVGRGTPTTPPDLRWVTSAALRAGRRVRESSPLGLLFPAAPTDAPEPATVVYVDDDIASRELLVEFFRLLPAFDLVAVDTIDQARRAVVEHRPVIVISDAWLGEGSAEPFVTELLAGSRLDPPAVVVLSADANASTIARFRRLGIAEYLSKPIQLNDLSTICHELARSVAADEGNGTRARTNAASGN